MKKSIIQNLEINYMDKSVFFFDLLVGEKRKHKEPWMFSGLVGRIRYSQRRGRKP